jgi:aryl-alcohol dehydrogenase-like predicted oxidoreductase
MKLLKRRRSLLLKYHSHGCFQNLMSLHPSLGYVVKCVGVEVTLHCQATKMEHLEEAVAALNVKLTDEEIKYLEELYIPHHVTGIK